MQSGSPWVWILWIAASAGGAFLFLSGDAFHWAAFLLTQVCFAVAAASWVNRTSWRFAGLKQNSEIPLWKAAGEAIHDVGTPLHVMRFCIQQLTENPSIAATPRFLEQLTRSSDKTLESFERLRLFTRVARDEEGPANFKTVYEQALRVVRSRYPSHPALASLDAAQAPEEMVHIGSGALLRALTVLIGRCLSTPGTISVSVHPESNELRIAIAGEANGGDSSLDLETQAVRHSVEDWDGALKRTFFPERGTFGYALHLAREVAAK